MKLGAVLLASLSSPAEGGRKWNLLDGWKLARSGGFVEGGNLRPRRLEENINNVNEQNRVFPFCPYGDPSRDNCYSKCDFKTCHATLQLFTQDYAIAQQCRKKTPKRIDKKEACIKHSGKDLAKGEINFNAATHPDKNVHHTLEIIAPRDHWVQLRVKDYNITPHAVFKKVKVDPNCSSVDEAGKSTCEKHEVQIEQCGWGGIYIFSGEGEINQMTRVTEFCGDFSNPVADKNIAYPGENNFEANDGFEIVRSSRVIIAVSTSENVGFSTQCDEGDEFCQPEVFSHANATIDWQLVKAPEVELKSSIEYVLYKLKEKWNRSLCDAFPEYLHYDSGLCQANSNFQPKKGNAKHYRQVLRWQERKNTMLEKLAVKGKKTCFRQAENVDGTTIFAGVDGEQIVQKFNNIGTYRDSLSVTSDILTYLTFNCKVGVFWQYKLCEIERDLCNINNDINCPTKADCEAKASPAPGPPGSAGFF
jgi:hypothetical protein